MMDRRTFLGSLVAALAGSEIVRPAEVPPVTTDPLQRLYPAGSTIGIEIKNLTGYRMPWFYKLISGKLRIAQDFQLDAISCELPNLPVDQLAEMLSVTNPKTPNGCAVELLINGRPLFTCPVAMLGFSGFMFQECLRSLPIFPALIIPAETELEFRCPGGEGVALYLSGSVEASFNLSMDAEFADEDDADEEDDEDDFHSASPARSQVASTTQQKGKV